MFLPEKIFCAWYLMRTFLGVAGGGGGYQSSSLVLPALSILMLSVCTKHVKYIRETPVGINIKKLVLFLQYLWCMHPEWRLWVLLPDLQQVISQRHLSRGWPPRQPVQDWSLRQDSSLERPERVGVWLLPLPLFLPGFNGAYTVPHVLCTRWEKKSLSKSQIS